MILKTFEVLSKREANESNKVLLVKLFHFFPHFRFDVQNPICIKILLNDKKTMCHLFSLKVGV
jgi:hypothetical protein